MTNELTNVNKILNDIKSLSKTESELLLCNINKLTNVNKILNDIKLLSKAESELLLCNIYEEYLYIKIRTIKSSLIKYLCCK